jgi:uncharacterized protein YeaO (DUF488 family)
LPSTESKIHSRPGATWLDEVDAFAITYNVAQTQIVTLVCHCAEDEPYCHRHLLKALLKKKI